MIVVGGIYNEVRQFPPRDEYTGPGLRAAAAIKSFSRSVRLKTFATAGLMPVIIDRATEYGIDVDITEATRSVALTRFHSLSRLTTNIISQERPMPIRAEADTVLRFAMYEGTAVVKAKRAVYVYNSYIANEGFRDNGSSASQLAIIITVEDLERLTGLAAELAGDVLLERERAKVVVARLGPQGIRVHIHGHIPAHIAPKKFEGKYNNGGDDVFAAIFAAVWGYDRADPIEAVKMAAGWEASFFRAGCVPPGDVLENPMSAAARQIPRPIYLAGSSTSITRRWLMEEAHAILDNFRLLVLPQFLEAGDGLTDIEESHCDEPHFADNAVLLALPDDVSFLTELDRMIVDTPARTIIVFTEAIVFRRACLLYPSSVQFERDFVTAVYRAAIEAWIA